MRNRLHTGDTQSKSYLLVGIIPGVVRTGQETVWSGLLPATFCERVSVWWKLSATLTLSAHAHLCIYGCSSLHPFGLGSLDVHHTQTQAADSVRCHT